jgi:branched-chain amino acid transport system substrate-binding protein
VQILRRPWLWVMALAAVLLIAAVACEEEEEEAVETPPVEETPTVEVTPGPGVTDTEIKLGHTNDLAGIGGTPYGIITPAINAYFSKVNEEDGGVCGRDITLIAEDDQYAPALALEKTKKLVEQDEVLAIVGALGTAAHLGAVDYLNDPNGDGDTSDGIPDLFISTGFTGWGDYATWPWTVGYIPDYVSDGTILTTYINDNFPGQKVGIIYQNDPFGEDYLNALKDTIADPTLIVSEQSVEVTATDVSPQVVSMQQAGAEVVYLGVTPSVTARTIITANAMGYSPQWIMSYVNPPTDLADAIGGGEGREAGAQLLAGALVTTYGLDLVGDADDPALVEHARIMETYGGPAVSTLSQYGHGLAEVVVEALSGACDNLTREGLLESVESIQGFSTSVGYPGIEVNLGPTDHYSIEALGVFEIQPDASIELQGEIISVE